MIQTRLNITLHLLILRGENGKKIFGGGDSSFWLPPSSNGPVSSWGLPEPILHGRSQLQKTQCKMACASTQLYQGWCVLCSVFLESNTFLVTRKQTAFFLRSCYGNLEGTHLNIHYFISFIAICLIFNMAKLKSDTGAVKRKARAFYKTEKVLLVRWSIWNPKINIGGENPQDKRSSTHDFKKRMSSLAVAWEPQQYFQPPRPGFCQQRSGGRERLFWPHQGRAWPGMAATTILLPPELHVSPRIGFLLLFNSTTKPSAVQWLEFQTRTWNA